jgi:predicted Zn-ribbon and HTH transcriptional regulator
MSLLPMKKCKKCGYVFTVSDVNIEVRCPKCGSLKLKKATPIDLISMKKYDDNHGNF